MLRRLNFRLIAVLVVVAAVSVAGLVMERAAAAPAATQAASKAALLFNITSGTNGSGVHAVSMALGLAGNAAKEGHEVVVFLNVDATQFASKNLSENVKCADFPPIRQLVASVIGSGGKVLVCKHCATVARVDTKSLVDGAVLANHEDILAQIRPGTVGFSY